MYVIREIIVVGFARLDISGAPTFGARDLSEDCTERTILSKRRNIYGCKRLAVRVDYQKGCKEHSQADPSRFSFQP
jgi:hypothetical protein